MAPEEKPRGPAALRTLAPGHHRVLRASYRHVRGDKIVLPGQLWRLAWPIPLAAALSLGWAASRRRGWWRGTEQVSVPRRHPAPPHPARGGTRGGGGRRPPQKRQGLLPLGPKGGPAGRSCGRPVYPGSGDPDTPSVVPAPDLENTCIPAYSAEHANVVTLGGGSILGVLPELEERTGGRVEVPQGVMDVRVFFRGPTDEEMVAILRRHDVDYVLVPTDPASKTARSLLYDRLRSTPLFVEWRTPGDRYAVFAVDERRLEAFD